MFVPAGAASGAVNIKNAHYYVWSNTTQKAYLVNLDGAIKYYEVVAQTEANAGTDSLTIGVEKIGPLPVFDKNIVVGLLETATPPADIVTGRTYAQERQNFANWFQYYRKRWFTVVAAVTRTLPAISGVNVGYRMINGLVNGEGIEPVKPIDGYTDGVSNRTRLINLLEGFRIERLPGMTPLRKGLNYIGYYYSMTESTGFLDSSEPMLNDANCPISTDEGGECQQNFAVVLTDGSWNGGPPTGGAGGNADGDNGPPYADEWQSTLADVAMYWYETDLAPTVDNNVPTSFIDDNNKQHMVTYGITFGVLGNLDPDDYDFYDPLTTKKGIYDIVWPKPDTSDPQAKIDDVWHAAVNGRGKYLSADNPEELIQYFQDIMNDLMARIGSGASVSVNGEELNFGTVIYQSTYNTEGWSGDVKAYQINVSTGEVDRANPIWSAEVELLNTDWNTGRIIATYDGKKGLPFRYDSSIVGGVNRKELFDLLDPSATTATNMVNYLRGDSTLELKNADTYGGNFRNREFRLPDNSTRDFKLGDIVSSSPLFQGYLKDNGDQYGVLYVGANDGMLHAFDSATGQERFAYVPRLVFNNLKYLTQAGYVHRYYVNLTPYIGMVSYAAPGDSVDNDGDGTVDEADEMATLAMLVGGLGKGGKGYYALDVSNPESITSESTLADKVLWEFPRPATTQAAIDDMGFSYGRAFMAQSNDPAHPWVVIFANGYNSPNEHAVLFILDALTGTLVKRIDTGVGSCNGLSDPVLIDPNFDGKVDYVYAGDLKGNMWKFDLTATSANTTENKLGWTVAYRNNNGTADVSDDILKPLFTAKHDNDTPANAADDYFQPITAKPDVIRHPLPGFPGYIVIFGTGKYLGTSDFSNTEIQTLYGVWDFGDDADDNEYLGTFQRDQAQKLSHLDADISLLKQKEIAFVETTIGESQVFVRIISDYPINYETEADGVIGQKPNPSQTVANHAGWYLDLPIRKERIVRDLTVRSGRVIVITSIPTASACAQGGESILLEVDATGGGRLTEPVFDINNDDVIDSNDVITITNPEWTAWVAGGEVGEAPEQFITVTVSGLHFDTMLFPPSILKTETKTIKILSTSGGGIVVIDNALDPEGIYYWRHIQ
ncbi:MAG: PilC/PilY family type IV pilus protein [Pseudomonadota bacterium]